MDDLEANLREAVELYLSDDTIADPSPATEEQGQVFEIAV